MAAGPKPLRIVTTVAIEVPSEAMNYLGSGVDMATHADALHTLIVNTAIGSFPEGTNVELESGSMGGFGDPANPLLQ